jgi:hypothetical protein
MITANSSGVKVLWGGDVLDVDIVMHAEPMNVENVARDMVEKIGRQSSGHRFLIAFPRSLLTH